MKIRIKVLSPVHIGCGETYSGLNYIIDKGNLYYIDPDRVLENLDGYQNTFVKWLESESNKIAGFESKIDEFKKTRKFKEKKEYTSKLRPITNQFHLKKFCYLNKVPLTLLNNAANYAIPVKEKIFDSTDIAKFISQINRHYIPGTEIKGAIRTAVLYKLFKDNNNLFQEIKKDIEKFGSKNSGKIDTVKNKKRPNSNIKKELNKKMRELAQKMENLALKSPGKNDAKYDLLKYLFISDSNLREPFDTLAIAYATPLNSSRFFKLYYEYCKPETVFKFEDISVENTAIKMNKLGFTAKQKNVVSSLESIFACCHDFSHDLLEEEITFYKTHGKIPIVDHLRNIAKVNTAESPVLRIGKDQGFLSLTMGLLFKKKEPDLYENVLIHATKSKSYDSSHGGPLPKTRKVVHYDGDELTSGWVKILPQENDFSIESKQLKSLSDNKSPTKDSLNALMNKWGKP
ncbi:MAG: type III-A CRISPR-associated RAMP protein Csm5 [Deltaproteobacteria bacterium]|nr:type III-A CRISPR-associated RAMP protein Csm5 [Deltaproteobacteria bacterium]